MKIRNLLLSAVLVSVSSSFYETMGQTLEECQKWAQSNYPLIAQYDLVEMTREYDLNSAANGWIPKIVLSAQASYQSDVANFPEEFNKLYQVAGIHFEGLRKDQYRVALDVEQPIWDGGTSVASQKSAEAESDVKAKNVETQLYSIRGKVNDLFFGILLIEEQLKLNSELQTILTDNVRKAESLVKEGVMTSGDLSAIKAELLKSIQDRTAIEASRKAYKDVLEIFTGCDIGMLIVPEEPVGSLSGSRRPELELFDLRLNALDAQRKMLDTSVIPRFSLFAQGFYGSPGLNMFDDMVSSHFSLNGIVGVRMQWNIGGFFTKRNGMKKIDAAGRQVNIDREVFLFNNNLKSVEQRENINAKRMIISQDDEILRLRSEVREAYQSKVDNGVADSNDLLREIGNENMAKISAATHRIDLLKALYDLEITVGTK